MSVQIGQCLEWRVQKARVNWAWGKIILPPEASVTDFHLACLPLVNAAKELFTRWGKFSLLKSPDMKLKKMLRKLWNILIF